MIQGHGPSNPKGILIAGFAHGEDLTSNYALTGYKEHALKELCSKAGLKLADFYRTCYIKNDAKFNEDIEGEELAKLSEPYKKILIDEINDLKTNLLIPLDELAFNFVADLHGIRKFRGSILPCNQELGFNRPLKVLPILGPYPYLQKEFPLKWISEIDFQKIPKHWEDAKIPDQFTNCWVARNPGSLREFLNRSYNEDGILNFDIETYLGIPTCISLCFDGQESVCVPLFDEDIDADSSTLMWMSVAKLLNSPIKKVNQNIKYDWKIEERWGFKVNNIYGDPQIASSLILPELKRNLGFLTSLYTDLPYFKDEGKEWNPKKYNKDRFYMYNAKDSLASWKIHKEQEKELEELGCTQLYRNLIQSLIVYKTMENVGIRVDDEARRGFLEKYESLYRIETMKLAELSGRPLLNPLSSVIAKNVLFEDCGFDPRQKGINGKTGEDQIKLLLAYGNAKNSPIHGPDRKSVV